MSVNASYIVIQKFDGNVDVLNYRNVSETLSALNKVNMDGKKIYPAWFILSDFGTIPEMCHLIHSYPSSHIMGLPAFLHHTVSDAEWKKCRPVFNLSMANVVVCVTGFRDKATIVSWRSCALLIFFYI